MRRKSKTLTIAPTNFCLFSDDFNRVVLEPEIDVADSDYINASYVDVSLA